MLVADQLLRVPPAHRWVPPHATTSGPECADLAGTAGLILDGEQRLAVDVMLAETPTGEWAAFEAALIAARQNLKTVTFQAIALFKLFLLQDRLTVWTAHEFSTAIEAFRDLQVLIDNAPHLSRKVKHVNNTNGEEGIELLSGARLIFRARSKRAGRGLSGNTVILDEAFALMPSHMGSLLPTLSAVPNSQVFYGSSAGHTYSAILRGVRNRGRAGGSPSLAYLEWCAPPGGCGTKDCDHRLDAPSCALDDQSLWLRANPALGRRLSVTAIAAERQALASAPMEFARERLGWWEDPPPATGGALDPLRWADLRDLDAPRGTPVVWGLDVAEDRSASVAVGWRRPDQSVQVMVDRTGPSTGWVVPRLQELHALWGGRVVLGGAAESLQKDLDAAGVPTLLLTGREFVQACGLVDDAVTAGTVRHGNQPELNEAVRVAKWRPVGTANEKAWLLKDLPAVGPLVAVTRVLAGLRAERPDLSPVVAPLSGPGSSLLADVNHAVTAQF